MLASEKVLRGDVQRLIDLGRRDGAMESLSDRERAEFGALLRNAHKHLQPALMHAVFPETGPFRRELYPKHMEHFAAGQQYKVRGFRAGNRVGKGLPPDELVMTPEGPCRIGDVQVGGFVTGSNGQPTRVLAKYNRGLNDLYRVTLTDDATVITDHEHLWRVRKSTGKRKPRPWRLRSTEQMFQTGRRYEVPDRPVVDGSEEPPIDPYLLGCLIGDGGLTKGVTLTTMDDDIAARCEAALEEIGCVLTASAKKGAATTYSVRARERQTDQGGHPLPNAAVAALSGLGLFGCKSAKKFIPKVYLRCDAGARLELLRGLMDTDGTVDGRGTRSFSTVSHQLGLDVQALARSLGLQASLRVKKGRYRGRRHFSWRVIIHCGGPLLFSAERKACRDWEQWRPQRRLRIKRIEPLLIGTSICIRVAAPDGVFLTGDYVPTHNSWAGGFETACHATGWYPEWWDEPWGHGNGRGYRVNEAGAYICAAKTTKMLKKIPQRTLFGRAQRDKRGRFHVRGDGMIPAAAILHDTAIFMPAAPGTLSEICVRYRDSQVEASTIEMASYEQGRALFEGDAYHLAWMDEECPMEVYSEAVTRLMTTDGRMIVTYSPLDGLTDLTLEFMEAQYLPPAPRDMRVDLLV